MDFRPSMSDEIRTTPPQRKIPVLPVWTPVQSRPFPRPRNKPRHQLALPPSLPASLPIPHQKPRPVSSLKSVRPLTGERNDKRKGSYSHRVSWELGPANMTTNLIGFYWPKHASFRGISYMAYCIGSWQVCTCVLL